MDREFASGLHHSLIWLPAMGMGYLQLTNGYAPYDQAYFDKYVEYAKTPLGQDLNRFRLELVAKYTTGPVLDIGIGCGQFVESRNAAGLPTTGFDVNPVGQDWLDSRGWFHEWRNGVEPLEAVTCWDSMEHMSEPQELLDRVGGLLFASLPVFTGLDHVLASKHYRPDEHALYFTEGGLIQWMDRYGFDCLEGSRRETELGRQDIGTYVFRKRHEWA